MSKWVPRAPCLPGCVFIRLDIFSVRHTESVTAPWRREVGSGSSAAQRSSLECCLRLWLVSSCVRLPVLLKSPRETPADHYTRTGRRGISGTWSSKGLSGVKKGVDSRAGDKECRALAFTDFICCQSTARRSVAQHLCLRMLLRVLWILVTSVSVFIFLL